MPRIRIVRAGLVALGLGAAMAAGEASASNTCINYQTGDVFYVAYRNSPSGPEYIVDLGSRTQFLTATNTITFADVRAADFSSIFAGADPNLFVGIFGIQNPATRDAILAANGAKNDAQCSNSSTIGASQQIDTWGTGLAFLSNGVGGVCSPNAATFAGNVQGSYQATLNGFAQGSLGANVIWNEETRLSNGVGLRTQPPKTQFFATLNDPQHGTCTRSCQGYFQVFVDGHIQYWPDRDCDLLPDVPVGGGDPNADRCPGVADTNNTDSDNDNHAAPCDCNEGNNAVWSTPTEVSTNPWTSKTAFSWAPPSDAGATTVTYDVLRSTTASAPACFQNGLAVTNTTDNTAPALGGAFYYLVRADNACPGSAGFGSVGNKRIGGVPAPRTAPPCP